MSARHAAPWLVVLFRSVFFGALAVFGAVRLAQTPTQYVAGVKLRIMQPNLTQDENSITAPSNR